MNKGKKLYEGKAKILYEGPEKGTAIQHFKDETTAFGNRKKTIVEGKGVLNNRISEHILNNINQIGIPTHLIKRLNMREQLVRWVEIYPIKFIVRNIASGSLTKRLGIVEGTILSKPLIEYFYNNDDLSDPLISKEHIYAFNWLSKVELDLINERCVRINDFMQGMFRSAGIKLVDFKLEFGKAKIDGKTQIFLADEISPDTCRLWDLSSEKKLDKDRFRNDLGNITEGYQEVARRLGIMHEGSNISEVKFGKPKAVDIKKRK